MKKEPPAKMNGSYIKNALKSIGKITVESITDNAGNAKTAIKSNAAFFKEAKSKLKKPDSTAADDLDDSIDDNDVELSFKPEVYRFDNIIENDTKFDDTFKFNHIKNNVIIRDLNFRTHAKLIYKSIYTLGNHNRESLSIVEHTLNYLIEDVQNDVNFFANTLRQVNVMNRNLAYISNTLDRIANTKVIQFRNQIEYESLNQYISLNRMFSVRDMVDAYNKNTNESKEILSELEKEDDRLLRKIFGTKFMPFFDLANAAFVPLNVKNTIKGVKSLPLNAKTMVQYILKDMAESDNPLSVMIAERMGYESKSKQKATRKYDKKPTAFDSIIRRSITKTIPFYLSSWLAAISNTNEKDRLTYDYELGGFVKKSDKDKFMEEKYKDFDPQKFTKNNYRKYTKKLKTYYKDKDRFTDDDILDKDDFEEGDNIKIQKIIKRHKTKKQKGFNLGVKITDKIDKVIDRLDKFIFKQIGDSKYIEDLIMQAMSNTKDGDGVKKNRRIFHTIAYLRKHMLFDKMNEFTKNVLGFSIPNIKKIAKKYAITIGKKLKIDVVKNYVDNLRLAFKEKIRDPIVETLTTFSANTIKFLLEHAYAPLDNYFNTKMNIVLQEARLTLRGEKLFNFDKDGKIKKLALNPMKYSYHKLIDEIRTARIHFDAITEGIKAAVTNPIRVTFNTMSNNYYRIGNIDKNVVKGVTELGIDPELVPHQKYDLSTGDKWKKYFFRPIKHVLGYVKDVLYEISPIKSKKQAIDVLFYPLRALKDIFSYAFKTLPLFIRDSILVTGLITRNILNIFTPIANKVLNVSKNTLSFLTTKVVPGIADFVGKTSVFFMDQLQGAAEFGARTYFKLVGGAFGTGIKAIKGLVYGATGMVMKIKDMTDLLFIKDGGYYSGKILGGNLDGIRRVIKIYEVVTNKSKFKAEDEEDAADVKKKNKLVSAIKSLIGGRIANRNKLISNMMTKALSFGFNTLKSSLFFGASLALGGKVGNAIGNVASKVWNTKIGKKIANLVGKKVQVMDVYIVGGSLDGNSGLGNILGNKNNKIDADDVDDVTDTFTDKIKNKVKKFIPKNKKKLLGVAATTTVAVGGAAIYNKKKKEKEESKAEIDKAKVANEVLKTDISTIKELDSQLKAKEPTSPGEKQLADNSRRLKKISTTIPKSNEKKDVEAEIVKTDSLTKDMNLFNKIPEDVKPSTLAFNKKQQTKVEANNENRLFSKLNDNEKLERMASMGAMGVAGRMTKTKTVGSLSSSQANYLTIRQAFLEGFKYGGMIGGAIAALAGSHLVKKNKKLFENGKPVDNEKMHEILKELESGAGISNATSEDPNASTDPNANIIGGGVSGKGYMWPVPGQTRISSPYGWRIHPVDKVRKMHKGIDISSPGGKPMVAAKSGTVIFAGASSGYGNRIDIQHEDGYVSRYAHMWSVPVKKGDVVQQGQEIAKVGSAGKSTGPHLHFEIRSAADQSVTYDPEDFVDPATDGQPAQEQSTAQSNNTDITNTATALSLRNNVVGNLKDYSNYVYTNTINRLNAVIKNNNLKGDRVSENETVIDPNTANQVVKYKNAPKNPNKEETEDPVMNNLIEQSKIKTYNNRPTNHVLISNVSAIGTSNTQQTKLDNNFNMTMKRIRNTDLDSIEKNYTKSAEIKGILKEILEDINSNTELMKNNANIAILDRIESTMNDLDNGIIDEDIIRMITQDIIYIAKGN